MENWTPTGEAANRIINQLETRMTDMLWRVSIWTEIPNAGPASGREVNLDIYAKTGKSALIKAISEFELQSDELIHDVHISRPEEALMTDTTELIAAVRGVLPYLDLSSEETNAFWARNDVKRQLSKADRMRAEAAEIEAKDAAIVRLRAVVAALAEEEA